MTAAMIAYLLGAVVVILVLPSIRMIGPTQIGLVLKRFSFKKLSEDNPIAFQGEPGYQAELLMPGFRFKFWILYKVEKHSWVQIPAGQIGVVISQIGAALPVGAKSAVYKPEFGNFTHLKTFVEQGGQKGVQRPVLPPGTLAPIHPVGFLVITQTRAYGIPVSTELKRYATEHGGTLDPAVFGLAPEQLSVTRIEPFQGVQDAKGKMLDTIGIVTVFEGDPLPAGDIASRIGGFKDIEDLEKSGGGGPMAIEKILGMKNEIHNNYQDFQKFLDAGGKIGLQHDPLLYGAYNLNPFLVGVETVPMLVVQQGEVAVIKAYVGLPSEDVSGLEFKFGTLVKPGHRGIWEEPLRTGKYPINPRCYQAEIVPTFILTLSWADATSRAHQLDAELKPIDAKSREGFIFHIDLQVQIHVPDTKAPRVISIVGTMQNLVSEVLQAAVGNHFRDKLQSLPAVRFIETRQEVQREAFEHIKSQLNQYEVETKGVYIQDVVLPAQLVEVLTQREIANQRIETLKKQQQAEGQRISMEKTKGQADMQAQLASSEVQISIKENNAKARKAEADGEAAYIQQTGTAKGAEVRAVGLARAEGYRAQVEALGSVPTAVVNAVTALSDKNLKFVPEILVTGGSGAGAVEGLAAALMRYLNPGKAPADSKEEKAALPAGKAEKK
ncbi:MAG: SPFH domain-containing protein [Phycisphaerae bacterium]|jgi:regulator of protease activity HflC (stomatin/prohibitin superfamily)